MFRDYIRSKKAEAKNICFWKLEVKNKETFFETLEA